MLVGLSGPAFTRNPGDYHECDDAEALRLIKAGYAIALDSVSVESTDAIRPVGIEKRRRKKV